MDFDWGEDKNSINRSKHRLSFEAAIHIFDGPVWTQSDLESDEGEYREINIGMLPGSTLLGCCAVLRLASTIRAPAAA